MNMESTLAGLRRAMPVDTEPAVALGTGLAGGFDEFESPVGTVIVSFNVRGVRSVQLASEFDPSQSSLRLIEAVPPKGWDTKINRAIERGRPGDLPLDLTSVTEFQQSVLDVAAAIPFGQVRPYGWLAAQVGNPGAVRAVGSTMAKNPVPLIIPCHRVVRSDGRIGNYSLGGAHNKTELLGHEGVDVDRLSALATRHVRFTGSDTTKIFCHPTCSHARRTTAAHAVEFRTASEAEALGYRACKVCRP